MKQNLLIYKYTATDNNGYWFQEFDPLTGKLPTIVTADFLNMILLELRTLEGESGIPNDTPIGEVLIESVRKVLQTGTSNNASKLNNKSPSYYLSSTNLTGTLPQARLASSYNFDALTLNSLDVDNIREKTVGEGVKVEQMLIKDNDIHMSGSSIISANGSIYIHLDANDNETNKGLFVKNNGVDMTLYLQDEGGLNLYREGGGTLCSLYDTGAANANEANPYMQFRYSAEPGGASTRLGYIGFGSGANSDIIVTADDGNVRLDGTKILGNGVELVDVDDLTDYLSKDGTTEMTGPLELNNQALIFNNGGDAGSTDDDNIDHIWHSDGANAYHLVSDGAHRSKGNGKLFIGAGTDVGNAATYGQLMSAYSNRNLLKNSNFKIDTRGVGASVVNDGEFLRDGWRSYAATNSITVDTDGTVNIGSRIYQQQLSNIWDGKVVVASVEDLDVDLRVNCGNGTYGIITAGSGKRLVSFVGQSGTGSSDSRFYIRAVSGTDDPFSFKNLKLEYGDIATRYDDPDEAEELLKCQKHYQTYNLSGLVATKSPDGFVANVIFPEMASIPSVMPIPVSGGGYNGTSAIGISTVLVDSIHKNSIRLLIETSSAQTAQSIYVNNLVLTLYTGY